MMKFRSILALSVFLGLSSVACLNEEDVDEDEQQEEMGSTESEMISGSGSARSSSKGQSNGGRRQPPPAKVPTKNASQRRNATQVKK